MAGLRLVNLTDGLPIVEVETSEHTDMVTLHVAPGVVVVGEDTDVRAFVAELARAAGLLVVDPAAPDPVVVVEARQLVAHIDAAVGEAAKFTAPHPPRGAVLVRSAAEAVSTPTSSTVGGSRSAGRTAPTTGGAR